MSRKYYQNLKKEKDTRRNILQALLECFSVNNELLAERAKNELLPMDSKELAFELEKCVIDSKKFF